MILQHNKRWQSYNATIIRQFLNTISAFFINNGKTELLKVILPPKPIKSQGFFSTSMKVMQIMKTMYISKTSQENHERHESHEQIRSKATRWKFELEDK